MIEITRDEIDVEAVTKSAYSDASGAVVTFLGTARQDKDGKNLVTLDYDAYPEMAVKKMEQVRDEIIERWPADQVSIVHRFGPVGVRVVSVAIAISCPHRKEAFEACEYAIDRIKEIVPVWKKEVYEDGSEWVEQLGK
ncbi:MAG: molybdenum cofactor biosynthesis protein MoaE [Planctomycetota bacterium]|jgi:molybdopterin synthase catalytic subunit|nr:molybdenum cofactor biosynthesis protein MoaE [Planctomycetota bacterium]MDP7249700.1 molybdenum cofactor biosynthesis protein MoaE [Planctomycetota bacterium]